MIDLDNLQPDLGDDAEAYVDVFKVNGKIYSVPKYPRVGYILKAAWIAKVEGDGPAEAWLLRELLGEEGWEALTSVKRLDMETFKKIAETVQRIAAGEPEPEEGKGRTEPRIRREKSRAA